jgi:hypothetical protein
MTKSDYVMGDDALGKNGAAYTAHLLKVAYDALFPDLVDASPHLGLTIDGEPVRLGELGRAKPPTAIQPALDGLWRSGDALYGLGVIAPFLHVKRDMASFWTLSLTLLLVTSAASKKALKALRHELSGTPRSSTFKILDGVAPFAPQGAACFDLKKPKGSTLFEPLPDVPAGEARAWIHAHRPHDRVFMRGLRVGYMIGSSTVDLETWTFVPDIVVSKIL